MPTNFEFLKEDYPDLFDWAHDMEKKVKQDPNGAINSGSKFFERILNILDKKDGIERIYINFCNPWPRGKHRKKRLTHTRQLEKYREFLKEWH